MKINWKDFGLICIVALVLLLVWIFYFETAMLTVTIAPTFWLIFFLFVYGVSLMFYFWRNKSELKETLVISFAFGFIVAGLWQLSYSFIIWPIVTGLTIQRIDWLNLLTWQLLNSVGTTIWGLIIWFAVNKLKWEKS